MLKKTTARLHLLPAKEAPYVVIVRRKPSKTFHIVRWNTKTDTFEHGSWFNGKLYPMRCDVSFDGHWMVYLAMGDDGNVWNGCCQVPYLKTYLEGDNIGTWNGGGYWKERKTLATNNWTSSRGSVPFKTEAMSVSHGEDFGVLFPRMERDGWKRNGDNWGTGRKLDTKRYKIAVDGDDGWTFRFSGGRPALKAFYRGYLEHGQTFEFELTEYPGILDSEVEWAALDCRENLVFARSGWVFRYSKDDLEKGQPGFAADLNGLTREAAETGPDHRFF